MQRTCNAVLGIDIGATKVCIALVDPAGNILHMERFAVHGSRPFPERLTDYVDGLLKNGEEVHLLGIGIGVKGLVDASLRTIESSSVLKPYLPWDICTALERRYGVRTLVDNDVHAATVGELLFGAGKQLMDFIYVNVGTGLAAGVVCGGKLMRGGFNKAGEVGCWQIPRAGTTTGYTMLENIASGAGLVCEAARLAPSYPESRLASRLRAGETLSGKDITQAVGYDALATAAGNAFADSLSCALCNLALLCDPQAIIAGGGVLGDASLLSRLTQRLQEMMQQVRPGWKAALTPSSLGVHNAAVLGAAAVWYMAEG